MIVVPVADITGLFRSLELETDAGKVNLATIALVLSGFGVKQVLEALGALIDRLIIVFWYRNREPPSGLRINEWVDERSVMKEVRLVMVMAALCLAGLGITIGGHGSTHTSATIPQHTRP
jgi:hypothetical protein